MSPEQRTPPKRPNTTVNVINGDRKATRECSERTATHVLVTVFDVKVYFTRDLGATSSLDGLRAENGRECHDNENE